MKKKEKRRDLSKEFTAEFAALMKKYQELEDETGEILALEIDFKSASGLDSGCFMACFAINGVEVEGAMADADGVELMKYIMEGGCLRIGVVVSSENVHVWEGKDLHPIDPMDYKITLKRGG